MIRSLLFLPADSARKFDRALASDAHALILDLEDSVAPAAKPEARAQARQSLARPRDGKQVFVRVNAFDTGMTLQDLAAVMPGRPDGIMLPKSNSGQDVARLGFWLDGMEACLGIEAGATTIIPIVTETPLGLLNLASYAGCSARLWGMLWGAEDLAGAIGASANRIGGQYRTPFRLARDQCLMAAAAAGVVPIDSVFTDTRDADGLASEAAEARIEGFGAKAAIHPAQCGPINAAFQPTEQEIAWAQAVLEALGRSGAGVATLDGRMIDKPHEVQARRILGARSPG